MELLYKNNGVNVSKIDLIDLYYISVETSPNYFLIAIQRFMLIVCDSITGSVFLISMFISNTASWEGWSHDRYFVSVCQFGKN